LTSGSRDRGMVLERKRLNIMIKCTYTYTYLLHVFMFIFLIRRRSKTIHCNMYIILLFSAFTITAFTSARPQQLPLSLVPPIQQQGFVAPPQNNAINPSVSPCNYYLTYNVTRSILILLTRVSYFFFFYSYILLWILGPTEETRTYLHIEVHPSYERIHYLY